MMENIDKMNPQNLEFVNTLRGDVEEKEVIGSWVVLVVDLFELFFV